MQTFFPAYEIDRAGASPLPGRYYTASEIFAAELEKIFGERWILLGRAERVSQPGQFFVQEVGPESLLVVRTQAGQLRAFFNVCRHRGSQLCTQPEGQLSHSIQCPYHAWTYNLNGDLIGAPHMEAVPGFDRADYPLLQAGLHEWEGFLFANLASHPEPFEAAFAPLAGRFAAWTLPELRSLRQVDYLVQANWKLIVENYSECYHCPLVHPELSEKSPYRSGRNDLFDGPFLGGYMDLNHEVGSLTMSGQACAAPLRQVQGEDLNRVYYYSIFPNMLLSLHPDYALVHTLLPISPEQTRIRCEWLFSPEAAARPDFAPDEAVDFWDMTNRQDWRVCELSQRGVRSRAYQPAPYSASESLLAAFDREVLRALGGQTEPPSAEALPKGK